MGNRAIIKPINSNIGVYLHWNGGRDSVEGFLRYCELKGYDGFETSYGIARFIQIVSNFFGGTSSIGIVGGIEESLDYAGSCDHGIYIVKGWKIVQRITWYPEQQEYSLIDMLREIDRKQPISEQLNKLLDTIEVPVNTIKEGDIVFIQNHNGIWKESKIIGFGKTGTIVNGNRVEGRPYVNLYGSSGESH